MATRPRIKWKNILVWYAVLSAMLLVGGPLFSQLDGMLYQSAASYAGKTEADKVIHLAVSDDDVPQETVTFKETFVPVDVYHHEGSRIGKLRLDSATENAQTFSVFLKWLSQGGVKNIAISSPLTWDKEVINAEQSLLTDSCRNDNLFTCAVLGLPSYTAKKTAKTPGQLRFCEIPSAQISGSIALLPSANRARKTYLESWPEALSLNWAPDLQKLPSSNTAEQSYPLLVRWNGEVYPTLPLRLAMEMKKCKPGDVKVVLGKHIQMGDLVLPLDVRGCTPIKDAATLDLNAEAFGPGTQNAEALSCAAVVLLQAENEKESAIRAEKLAATLSMLCAKQKHEVIMQPGEPERLITPPAAYLCYAPLIDSLAWRIVSVLVLLFIAVRFIPSMSKLMRWCVLLLWLGMLLKTAWSALHEGYWCHIGVMLVVWVLLVIAMPSLKPVWKRGIFSSRR